MGNTFEGSATGFWSRLGKLGTTLAVVIMMEITGISDPYNC